MRMIELNMVLADGGDTREDEDGIQITSQSTSCPVSVAVDQIRCFYPRKENRPGTRLTFHNSAGMAVTDTYEEVKAKLATN